MEGVWMRWGLVATCEWLVPTSPHTMGRRGYPPCNSCAMGIQWYLELATVSWDCALAVCCTQSYTIHGWIQQSICVHGEWVQYIKVTAGRSLGSQVVVHTTHMVHHTWLNSAGHLRITAVYKISGDQGCCTHPRLLSCYYRCFPNRWIYPKYSFEHVKRTLINSFLLLLYF